MFVGENRDSGAHLVHTDKSFAGGGWRANLDSAIIQFQRGTSSTIKSQEIENKYELYLRRCFELQKACSALKLAGFHHGLHPKGEDIGSFG